ncbi:Pectinesterase 4 [Platanthera zijinensis]|uniref:Pectinesterase n=1 Tax=Platanthera zijinensis TaxID=2320716 RepID=A0AAP0B7V2_9ASPA
MVNKAVIGGFSAILLVAAVIGVVALVTRSPSGGGASNYSPAAAELTTTSKSVSALCAPTVYKDACASTLTGAINDSSTPGDIIRAAVNVITGEVQIAYRKTLDLSSQANGSIDVDGFAFCKQLLGDAGDQLGAVIAEADDGSRLDDFQAWLSMVISYRTNCLASIESKDLNAQMTAALQNTTQLADNAIAIISAVGKLAGELNLNFNNTAGFSVTGRRLAATGYPSWMRGADRKLLSSSRVIPPSARPNAVVAKDGSGQFKSINAALNAMPETYRGRYVIYVKAGVYSEQVNVDKQKTNLLIYGDGPRKTIVTGRLNNAEGVGTYRTATFAVQAPGFIARSIGFANTAGPQGHQAVALRLNADAAIIYNCRIDGFQDSFYTQTGRHFVRNSVISGTVDFIFGDSQVVIQNSLIILRRPMDNQENTVTAQGKDSPTELAGIVLQNCRIVPDLRLFPDRFTIPNYLGRPWKKFSTTVVMESTIGDLIRPEGWMPWDGDFALDTLYYAEYNNRGPGSPTNRRVQWRGFHVINRNQAVSWTAGVLLKGKEWIPYAGIPNSLNLMK